MSEKRRTAPFLILFFGMAMTIAAQTVQQPLTIEPNMVYVPVAVTGAKNAYIGGLKKENFQLREDNIEQTISAFSSDDQPFEMDIVLALSALQRGRSDLNSAKIREALETFRQTGNPGNKYTVEEMPFGSNGVFDAISRHVARLADTRNPRKALIVLTDGFDTVGGDPGRALQEYSKKLDVPIYLIFAAGTVGTSPADLAEVTRGGAIHLEGGNIYEDLTRFTGGKLYQAEADTQLKATLQGLAQELRSQYVLGFKSTNDARNDKWRKLEVKIKPPEGQKDLKVKVKDRYFVAKVKN